MDDFDINDLTDEQVQQLVDLGIIPDQQNALGQQMKTAEALRYGPGPEMRGNSRVQTAASPLEFLAHTMEGIKAGKKLEALQKQQAGLLEKQVAGRGLFFNKLRHKSVGGGGPAVQDPMAGYE